jgi:FLVCR family MFS transporter 7
MDDLTRTQTNDSMLKSTAELSEVAVTNPNGPSNSRTQETDFGGDGTVEGGGDVEAREVQPKRRRFGIGKTKQSYSHTHYKVYKRRWIGLAQLVLLNIVVSWDVSVPFLSVVDAGVPRPRCHRTSTKEQSCRFA